MEERILLDNPWIVGIAGGIISGFILIPISFKISSMLGRTEYFNKVSSANKEVRDLLKSIISENKLPSVEVIESLISSTSRKYGVKIDNMYSSGEVIDDLIREVYDTGFLSVEKKIESSEMLKGLKERVVKKKAEQKEENREYDGRKKELREKNTIYAVFLTMVTVMLTITVMFTARNSRLIAYDSSFYNTLLIMITTLLVTFTLLNVIFMKRKQQEKRKLGKYDSYIVTKVESDNKE